VRSPVLPFLFSVLPTLAPDPVRVLESVESVWLKGLVGLVGLAGLVGLVGLAGFLPFQRGAGPSPAVKVLQSLRECLC
jgi:hypothetical protein